jgi:hypothetical protein
MSPINDPRDHLKPEKLSVFACRGCGAEFLTSNEALNCQRGHLLTDDIRLAQIEGTPGSQFCYEPQQIWPTFIRVSCSTRAIDGKVYQLVDTVGKGRKRVLPITPSSG